MIAQPDTKPTGAVRRSVKHNSKTENREMENEAMTTRTDSVSVKTVRRNCLECSGGSARYVLWCPCNGYTSTDCVFWPSRFGIRPETFVNRHGPYLLTPEIMPDSSVDLEELPATVAGASEWLRERHPEVEWDGPRERTPEEVELAKRKAARMRTGQQGGREIDSEADFPYENKAIRPRKPK